MAKKVSKRNPKVSAAEPGKVKDFIRPAEILLGQYGVDPSGEDVTLLAISLMDAGHLLAAHWDRLRGMKTASDKAVVASMTLNLPFGDKVGEVEVKLAYGTRTNDRRKTKLDDPNEPRLPLDSEKDAED